MKKCFNRMQTLKSGEECGKFSKRFLYKNLVGGTTTTGKEHNDVVGIEGVITRRTSVRRDYLPEQCIHANKESLFASVTWLMRLPRRIQRMLLVMTIPVLALIFTIATTSESRAAKTCDCGSTENGGKASDCCWEIIDGVLTISAATGKTNVSMKDYQTTQPGPANGYTSLYKTTAPWGRKNVTSVVFDEEIVSIGVLAFYGENKITSVKMPKIATIKQAAFAFVASLENVDMPSITTLVKDAFYQATGLQYIGLPPSNSEGCLVDKNGDNLTKGTDNCVSSVYLGERVFQGSIVSDCSIENRSSCINCGNKYVKSGTGCVSECGTGYYADEETKRCLRGCSNGQVEYEGQCLDEYPFAKKRWTPAEANEWLHDGNDNFVIITFKK